jgi:predicted  nucleic acid-binding Zn-ribbon protein
MSEHPLLIVQRLDNELTQHRHARAHVDERLRERECVDERKSLETQRDRTQSQLDELDIRRRHFEGELELLDGRRSHSLEQLAEMTSPKQAQALQQEIDSLLGKISDLEDSELALLGEMEPLEELIGSLSIEMTSLDGQIGALGAEADRIETQLDEEVDELTASREVAAQETGPDLIKQYEHIRPDLGARAVVTFDGKNCTGCPFAMPAVEADRVRQLAEGTVDQCGECTCLVCR